MTAQPGPSADARRAADALARSARDLTETLDVGTVGRLIVESVSSFFEVASAGLRLREPDGVLVLIARTSTGGPYMPVGHRHPPGAGIYQAVVESGQAFRVPDVLDDPRLALRGEDRERLARLHDRALLAVPLRLRERITGILSIAAATGRVFSDGDVALLQAFADQAALALETARSHAEVVQRQHEAEALARVAGLVSESQDLESVGQRIVGGVLDLLHVGSSALRLQQPDGSLVPLALGGRSTGYGGAARIVPPGVGLIGRAAQEGRPIWTADFRADERFATTPEIRDRNLAFGIVAGLAVPLRMAGRVTGVLSVGDGKARDFTEREIAVLQAFADQAAVAIYNAQNREALGRQAERLRILHQVDRALIAEQAPVAIAEAVVLPLRELLGVQRVIVNLFDIPAGEVEWLAAAGRRRQHLGPGVRYSLRLAGDVESLRRGEPQTMDPRALLPDPDAQALVDAGLNVYMVVPMIAGGELIGSVSICAERGPFEAEIVAIAREVADQLAIALAQARLHERVRRQAEELEVRVEERTRALSAATAEADRANQAKSAFLSRMSHELRTPLNAILGFAQLLEMDALAGRQRESVEQILRGGRHLLALINEVLEISRIESGGLPMSLEPVPIAETLAQALRLVEPAASGAGVRVSAPAIDDTLHVLADRQRLQQVLLNLLSNAIKYNRPEGEVRAACTVKAAGTVLISISDTGPGLTAEQQQRLFTPFDRLGAERTTVEGTGLGLALSRSLTEAMGGSMHVASEPGAGSTFTIELSVTAAPRLATAAGPREAPRVRTGASRSYTILYIEDNLSNLRLVEHLLSQRSGIRVLSAMQGRVGLDLARAHGPDMILLDRHLPDLDGEAVFALLREDVRTRDIPVVILSADAIPSGVRRLLDAGVRAYLTKPLDVREFLDVIDSTLPD